MEYYVKYQKPSFKKRFLEISIVIILFGLLASGFINKIKPSSQTLGTKDTEKISQKRSPINPNSLERTIVNALSGSKGTYAVAVKNLRTGESAYSNEHKVFDSGSLYKLWVMATVYNEIEKKRISPGELLSAQIADLNKEFGIASEDAELKDGDISMTVATALGQMITISHNYAAMLLTERVRLSKVKSFLDSNNLNESSLSPPKTTAADIALFFEKLYRWQLANEENTQAMMLLLREQTLNNKLPRYLPKDLIIVHKTGEIFYDTHDGGIVFTDKGNYIIVVLSQSDYPPGAEERIADISKAVYEYFQAK